jgi:hypothetical protein
MGLKGQANQRMTKYVMHDGRDKWEMVIGDNVKYGEG